MDTIARLARLDLNLLVALDALLDERSVTRAGKRVGLSQPAMSNALARLRDALDDPLLVRTPRGMAPTPRAEALAAPIRRALRDIDAALAPTPAFDPEAPHTFTLAVPDYVGFALLPALLCRVSERGPRVDLRVWPLTEGPPEADLQTGEVDLAISYFQDIPARLRREVVMSEQFVCCVRHGHPQVKQRLSLKRYVALRHILIAPRDATPGVVDRALSRRGLRRRVAITVPHFLVVPRLVASSDYVVTLAERVARAFPDALRMLPPPLPVPGFDVHMVWHPRMDRDPAHAWLRAQVTDSVADA